MPGELPLSHQTAEMVLQRVAASSGGTDHVGHCDAAVLVDVKARREKISHGCQFGATVRMVPCVWRSAK